MLKSSKKHKAFQKLEVTVAEPQASEGVTPRKEATAGQIIRPLCTCQDAENFLFGLFFTLPPQSSASSDLPQPCVRLSFVRSPSAFRSPLPPSFLPGRAGAPILQQRYLRARPLLLSALPHWPCCLFSAKCLATFFSLLVQIYSQILPLLMYKCLARKPAV